MIHLSAMRRRFLLLLPLLAALALLSWTPAASAHPGHEPDMHAQPAQAGMHVAVVQAAPHPISHHCPARCHGCTAECQMQCAAALALPTLSEVQFSTGRRRLAPAPVAARLSR